MSGGARWLKPSGASGASMQYTSARACYPHHNCRCRRVCASAHARRTRVRTCTRALVSFLLLEWIFLMCIQIMRGHTYSPVCSKSKRPAEVSRAKGAAGIANISIPLLPETAVPSSRFGGKIDSFLHRTWLPPREWRWW